MKKLILSILFFASVVAFGQNSFDRWVPVTGTNTYTTNITSFPASYSNTKVYARFTNGNTGASTLAVGGLSAIPIRKWDGDSWEPLVSGDIDAGDIAELSFNNVSTWFELTIVKAAGAGGGGGTQDLQSVLDEGSTANSAIQVQQSNIGIEVGGGTATVGQLTGSAGGAIQTDASGIVLKTDASGADPVEGSIFTVNGTGYLNDLAPGTSGYVLTSNGAGNEPTWESKVADAINDGTTAIAPSQNAVFDALALKQGGITGSQGDILYLSATNTVSNLAKSTSGVRVLSNQGSSNNPTWQATSTGAAVTLTSGKNVRLIPSDNYATGAVNAWGLSAEIYESAVITGNVTLTSASAAMQYADATSSAITVNLPALSGSLNKIFFVKNIRASGSFAVTLDGSGSETIDGSTTLALSNQFDYVFIQAIATGWQIIGRN